MPRKMKLRNEGQDYIFICARNKREKGRNYFFFLFLCKRQKWTMSMLARPHSTCSTPPANLIGKLSDAAFLWANFRPTRQNLTRCSLLRGSSPQPGPLSFGQPHSIMNIISKRRICFLRNELPFISYFNYDAFSLRFDLPSHSLWSSLRRSSSLARSHFLFIADTHSLAKTFTLVTFPLQLVILVASYTFGLANFHLHFAVSGRLALRSSALPWQKQFYTKLLQDFFFFWGGGIFFIKPSERIYRWL